MHPADPKPYWNTNVARHPDILRSVPEGCGDALDVGCGDGLLARKLAARVNRVTGIDKSPEMIARARDLAVDSPDLSLIEGDFLTADLPAAGYDFLCSVTTIHHMDFEAALVRMRALLRPGGTLMVVGLAREANVTEWAAMIAAAPVVRITKKLRRASEPEGMPVAVPRISYGQVRAVARRLLPGVRYRRHVLRRYSLTWEKPVRRPQHGAAARQPIQTSRP
ncbi:methyltransferase domain-containing protein [Streptomyces sp. SID4919]|uniref:class I SAM-dependent methyltransferase n=1 Tax=unclassified Streptomyces TaxID=2593676 RepID=UPI0008239DBB|nr:class I SAM-dependent methyltransferase [Streptomyces sp. AmelKG-E11A]MYY08645.1 methyltransferase domain-containing protein [Streptomyces sp. SID4919]SCK55649.1 Methylase involved in ubiquinone/menaquinone biosynthesis [Streptomyces sp. AmelKG-E11A]